MLKKNFKFIDLFCGIGGFHQALQNLGGKCVFASDIDKYAIETYKENYNINADINIRDIKEEDIPAHDVLCAGFPCQAFSKAININMLLKLTMALISLWKLKTNTTATTV